MVEKPKNAPATSAGAAPSAIVEWDHSSHQSFYDYYAKESQTDEARERFRGVRDCILRVLRAGSGAGRTLEVADIGCGAGTQSFIWAEMGHLVHAIDINEPLVALARERSAQAGVAIDFRIGLATSLPWPDESADVCIALELLEHVADWESCVNECIRILRPGGALFLTTTNHLCPVQAEFNLPLYSWYPAALKRYFERLAVTTRPDLANYAKYPAVNWFTYYGLRDLLAARGFRCLDRFDMMDLHDKGVLSRFIVASLDRVPPLRALAHVCTRGTRLLAIKQYSTAH
jgi:2-polyprenyl-3-methyl-5-hydroxy-6-metoxy-1,4-benzoquinol methylase